MVQLITPINQVDSSAGYTLGSRTITKDGNEYIYLRGCSGGTAYAFVSYGSAYASSLITMTDGATLIGAMASLQASITSTGSFGWALIKGTGTVLAGASVVINKALQPVTFTGYLDDTSTGSLVISGVWSGSTASAAGDKMTAILNYPSAINVALT